MELHVHNCVKRKTTQQGNNDGNDANHNSISFLEIYLLSMFEISISFLIANKRLLQRKESNASSLVSWSRCFDFRNTPIVFTISWPFSCGACDSSMWIASLSFIKGTQNTNSKDCIVFNRLKFPFFFRIFSFLYNPNNLNNRLVHENETYQLAEQVGLDKKLNCQLYDLDWFGLVYLLLDSIHGSEKGKRN